MTETQTQVQPTEPVKQIQGVRKNFPKVKKHVPALIMDKNTPDEYIADYPFEVVYKAVREGKWKQKDFQRWLKVLRVVE